MLAAVALALVAVAFDVKTTSWLGVAAGGWNAFNVGSVTPPVAGVTPPGETAPPREKTERSSEPSTADQDIEKPVGLGQHFDRTGQRGRRSVG